MNTNKSKSKVIVMLIAIMMVMSILVFSVFMLSNKGAPLDWDLFGPVNESGGIAIKGYDVVSYFTTGKPEMGNESVSYQWNKVVWYFSSESNRDMFKANPQKYAPQYGGYCATAVSKGISFDINPDAWHIEDEKLYLFYEVSAKNDWVKQIKDGVIEVGDNNWVKRKQ